jgi:hypothetical protein
VRGGRGRRGLGTTERAGGGGAMQAGAVLAGAKTSVVAGRAAGTPRTPGGLGAPGSSSRRFRWPSWSRRRAEKGVEAAEWGGGWGREEA